MSGPDRPPFPLAGSRVLVTGGAGFIGSHLVAALLDRGVARVTVLDSLRCGDPANLGPAAERVALVRFTLGGDDPAGLTRHLDGVDHLFHLAAEKHQQSADRPVDVLRANVEGTYHLLTAAARCGVRKVVFTSSLYAYGRMSGPPCQETDLPLPTTLYGLSKVAGEHLLRHAEASAGLAWTALRLYFVYGPRQFAGMGYKSVIVKNFERILGGEPALVHGDGTQALDYVYVDDVVEALMVALERGPTEVLNVASGTATPVRTLVETMLRVAGNDAPPVHGPPDWTAGSCRTGSPARIQAALGWRARVPLEEGLARTYRWMRKQAS
jgi:UDP-glucose 4-epimerase